MTFFPKIVKKVFFGVWENFRSSRGPPPPLLLSQRLIAKGQKVVRIDVWTGPLRERGKARTWSGEAQTRGGTNRKSCGRWGVSVWQRDNFMEFWQISVNSRPEMNFRTFLPRWNLGKISTKGRGDRLVPVTMGGTTHCVVGPHVENLLRVMKYRAISKKFAKFLRNDV